MMKTLIAIISMVVFATIGRPVTAAETGGHDQADQAQASPMILKIHERMQAIQHQMETIHATEDVNERHRLMHEHMLSMRDAMVMMHTMDQSTMPHGTEDDACVGQGMETMRMMTEQMMEHQRVREALGEQSR